MGLSVQEKKFKIGFQDGNCGSHLVFPSGTIFRYFWYTSHTNAFYQQGSGKPENSQSGLKIRTLDRFQTPQNANNSVQQVYALNPIFSPTNQFSGINDV